MGIHYYVRFASLALLVVLLVSSCNALRFEEPMPKNAPAFDSFPNEVLGLYASLLARDSLLQVVYYDVSLRERGIYDIRSSAIEILGADEAIIMGLDSASISQIEIQSGTVNTSDTTGYDLISNYSRSDEINSYVVDFRRQLFISFNDTSRFEPRSVDGVWYLNLAEGERFEVLSIGLTEDGLEITATSDVEVPKESTHKFFSHYKARVPEYQTKEHYYMDPDNELFCELMEEKEWLFHISLVKLKDAPFPQWAFILTCSVSMVGLGWIILMLFKYRRNHNPVTLKHS